ncbi:hypothetical protein WDW86_04210 [Bdellovibrionota bacterium FG-2]
MGSSTLAFVVTVCLIAATFLPRSGPASLAERDYDLALKIAERKVQRNHGGEKSSNGKLQIQNFSPSLSLNAKLYRAGQTWWVLAMSERIVPDHRVEKELAPSGHLGLFHYEILPDSSEYSGPPQFKIRVTQFPIKGQPLPDASVQSLELTLDEHLREINKHYLFLGRKQLTPVSPEGIRSGVTALEFFPLDAIDLSSVTPTQSPKFPGLDLPKQMKEALLALHSSYHFEFSEKKGTWLEQDDFFGRPINAFWTKNEPWPTYLHMPSGIAILLHEVSKP